VQDAKAIGDEFLALEKFVNLNYMGFHKILKKHDKMLPHTPCRQFYISHLHNQPWVQVRAPAACVLACACLPPACNLCAATVCAWASTWACR